MTHPLTADATTVTFHDPGELLAALPYLLGFHPEASVVLLAHCGAGARRLGTVVRADLPPPEDERALAEHMTGALASDGAQAATIAVVGTRAEPQHGEAGVEPAHAGLVRTIGAVLSESGLPQARALWTSEVCEGATWRCYDDLTCAGVLPDPGSSVMAAAATNAGLVTFGSRDAMRELVHVDDSDALTRRSALLRDASPAIAEPAGSPTAIEHGCAQIRAALMRARAGDVSVSDDQVVRLALALSESAIRDACLSIAYPTDHPLAWAAEQLWLALLRATPAPERAEPACLLGYFAYVRGDGALAGMAFDAALAADPGHVLSGLLDRALKHAIPPQQLRRLGRLDGVRGLWDPFDETTADETLARPTDNQ